MLQRLCRLNHVVRHYRFGREKPKPVAPPSMAEIEVGKLGVSNRLDSDGIRAKIADEVFNPYTELGLNPTAPLAEIQTKLKVRRKLVHGQLNGEKTGDNVVTLPIEYQTELAQQLVALDRALVIFESSKTRRQFQAQYELDVTRIIEANLTLGEKMSIQREKAKQYGLEKAREKVPSAIRTKYAFNAASTKQAKTQLMLKLNTPHKKYAFFSIFTLILPFYLILVPCHLMPEGAWERTRQEHHILPLAYVVYAWQACSSFYCASFLELYNYATGQRGRQVYDHSAVKEYESRNTELHQLALKLERLKREQ